jgi:hypothetical protein
LNKAIRLASKLKPGKDFEQIEKVPIGSGGEVADVSRGPDEGKGKKDKKPGFLSGIFGDKKHEARDFKPMSAPLKIENYGLEDAFKKAQQSVTNDPKLMAEMERKKIAADSLDTLRSIDKKTAPPESTAAGAF